MNPKTCARCGTQFVPRTGSAKYCGPECRRAVKTAQTNAYNATYVRKKPAAGKPISARRNTALRPGYDDDVLVSCWCQYTFVEVPAADIRNGRTGSCGLPQCRPPELENL